MAVPTAQQILDAWKAGTAGAGGKYTAGIQSVQDWAGPTLAAAGAWQQGLQAAFANGAWQTGVQRVGTGTWKNQTVAKAGNWTTAVNSPQAQANMLAGAQKLVGMLGTADSAISSLPRGTYDQNKARMLAFIDSMHAQKLAGA